ncbi:DNAJ heat shock N-terminal domain-containing protein [Cunninghamella echinulata]|nr:DNAJ heat shock N-terminal domain-containing protein [Cunninghamella echinulata]
METHYQVLNVSCDASFSEIKQRFQQLIIEHHPDKQNLLLKDKDEDRAQHILQAWNVLRNEEKRRAYDIELQIKTQKETITINDEIDLDDMEYNEESASYSLKCRCSGIYCITEEELEDGIDVIGCDNCSLKIRVIYDVVDDDDDL